MASLLADNSVKYYDEERCGKRSENVFRGMSRHRRCGKRLREMSDMEFATLSDETEILELYRAVIEQVNQTEVR